MLTLTALLFLAPAAPQGDDPIAKLLRAEGVTSRVPKRTPPGDAGTPRELLLGAGPGASSLAAALLVPAPNQTGPSAQDLLQQGIALHTGKRHSAPRPDRPRPRARTTGEIEQFFVDNHRDVRKAIGFDLNFSTVVPVLHGLMDRVLADEPGAAKTADDRKLIDRRLQQAAKVDQRAMHRAGLELVAMAFEIRSRRAMLLRLPRKEPRTDVVGEILFDKEFAFGRIVVGGPGRNIYDGTQIAVIIDLGGDDQYDGPVGGAHEARRYAVCIDLEGDDVYNGGGGSLGSATFGLGVCIDFAGNDKYIAGPRSAGFGAAGVGIFLDVAGDDVLRVGPMSGGVGLVGLGHCFDLAGDDQVYGSRSCFGIGLHAGFGSYVDVRGNDTRALMHSIVHPELTFGAARGLDEHLPGGFGVCLDLAGDDTYTTGNLGCGAGDLGGVGVCVDLSGDDRYIAGGLSLGAARRGGVGILLDVAGADQYFASEGMGAAGPSGAAFFEDRAGDDIYELTGAGGGWAAADGMAFFQDLGGKNRFRFSPGPRALLPAERGGIALFRSLGNDDSYTPEERGPGASGRRVETASSLALILNR